MTKQPQSEFSRLQGIAVLSCLLLACIVTNIQIIPTLEAFGPPSRINFGTLLMFSMIGILFAQPCMLVIWFAFSPDSLGRRLLLSGLGTVALFSAWLIGASFYDLEITGTIYRQLVSAEYWMVCLIPLPILALGLPLFLVRRFFRTQFRNLHWDHPVGGRQFTIKQILLFTSMVAATLACTQLPFAMGIADAEQTTQISAITGGGALAVGLLILLPFVAATMRERGFWFWSPILLIGGTGLHYAIRISLILIKNDQISNSVLRQITFEATIVAAGLTTIWCFLGGLRRLGYRIGRA